MTGEPGFSDSQFRTLDHDRDDVTTNSKRTSRKKLKTVDYSEIDINMLKAQRETNRNKHKVSENAFDDLQQQNSRFNTIDAKFKHDIDMMKARERNAQLPPNIGQSYDHSPNQ